MDVITLEEVKTLLSPSAGWCVSLYMPTHRAGRDTEQDPIRFKNMLRQVEERLLAKGLRTPDVRELLHPAQRLLQDSGFWRRQSDGLALFVAADTFQTYRLPLSFTELVVIADRFHVKPLLPFFASDGHFYILALSQNQVRLLEGTRHTVDEVELEKLPQSLADALQFERFERHLQFHTGASASGAGERAAVFHGHDPSDETKGRILRWFHKINAELPNLLGAAQAPMVLAGVEYLLPLYREANKYPHLLEKGILGNPERLKPEELHARAWEMVQPVFAQALEKAAAHFRQLADTERTTTDVAQAVLAAHHGRVEALFTAVDVEIWGTFDPQTQTVHVHPTAVPGDEDLLDLTAVQTMLNGGAVYVVEQDQVPGGAPLAALLRY